MEYTKGEWRIGENCNRLEIYAPFVNHGVIRIASADTTTILSQEERQANALLIAAAPDMYEALKEARITLNILQPKGSAVLREIDTALAKAEGKGE